MKFSPFKSSEFSLDAACLSTLAIRVTLKPKKNGQLGERREFARNSCGSFVAQWLERRTSNQKTLVRSPARLRCVFLSDIDVSSSVSWPAMQWHAYKRFFAFLSGNLAPLLLRLRYILNVFKFLSFVKSLSMLIDSLLTTILFLETKSLPSKPTKGYESEPDLPKPKMPLPNAGRSNRHCLSMEKIPNRQSRGKLTMSFRLAG